MEDWGIILFLLFIFAVLIIILVIIVQAEKRKANGKPSTSHTSNRTYHNPYAQRNQPNRAQPKSLVKNNIYLKAKLVKNDIYLKAKLDILVNHKINPRKEFLMPLEFFMPLEFDLCYDFTDTGLKNLKFLTGRISRHLNLPTSIIENTKFRERETDAELKNTRIVLNGTTRTVGYTNGNRIVVELNNKYNLYHYAAVIAHECTHCYLFRNNITLSDTHENEVLTEVAAVYLGFGGIYRYSGLKCGTEKFGYIERCDIDTIEKMIQGLLKKQIISYNDYQKSAANLNNTQICPNCKKQTPKEIVFCKHCGFEDKRICPNCKLKIPADTIFCKNCGFEDKPVENKKTAWW